MGSEFKRPQKPKSSFLVRIFTAIDNWLQKPVKVLAFCCVLAFLSLVVQGSVFQLYRLHRDHNEMITRLTTLIAENQKLDKKILKASDPQFLEQEARNRFDLAGDGDLIFVFTEE